MKIKSKILLYLFVAGIFFCLSNVSRSEQEPRDAHTLFYKANAAYKEGRYEQAKDGYEAILKTGLENGSLYYNLGNTYFKLGKPGRAMVNYERAKLFIPQDSDLKANLEFTRSLLENYIAAKKPFAIIRILQKLADEYSLDRLTLLGSIIYIILAVGIGAAVLWRGKIPFIKHASILLLLILAVLGSGWGLKFYETEICRNAIIVVSPADCKFAPAENAVTYFKLFEGTKVSVICENGDWFRVKTPDGKIGWIKSIKLEKIN